MIGIDDLVDKRASDEEIEEFVDTVLTELEEAIAENDKEDFIHLYLDIFKYPDYANAFIDELSMEGLERLQEIEVWKQKTFFNLEMKRAHKPTIEEMQALLRVAGNKEQYEALYNKIMNAE